MRTKPGVRVSTEPVERSAQPLRAPRLVYARDDVGGASKGTSSAIRLLIVEDDFLVASQIEAALQDAGFEICDVVSSAEQAIRVAGEKPCTLAIMDIRLSGRLDGVDGALELFRQHGLRCIFATAHSDAEVQKRAAPAKPFAWLSKPYTMASLVRAVRHAAESLEPKD